MIIIIIFIKNIIIRVIVIIKIIVTNIIVRKTIIIKIIVYLHMIIFDTTFRKQKLTDHVVNFKSNCAHNHHIYIFCQLLKHTFLKFMK